jgi:hypothetical protein
MNLPAHMLGGGGGGLGGDGHVRTAWNCTDQCVSVCQNVMTLAVLSQDVYVHWSAPYACGIITTTPITEMDVPA